MAQWQVGLRALAISLALFGAMAPVQAEQVVDLYSADILVASQSASERRRAAREGLEQLMVRVSGDPEAIEHSVVQEALSRAEDFIQEFNYVSTSETIEVEDEERPASRLVMKFSPPELERLLRSANLSLWPANRPAVLVWMVGRDDGELERISGSQQRDWLRDRARARGLPLVMPLEDLEDRLALSARELWELEEDVIRKASQRYEAEAILVGRYSETSGGQWRSDWQLYHSQGNPTFYLRAESVEALMGEAVDETANHFAELYAIVPREEGPDAVLIEVGGIDEFGDYKAVERYLEGLALVRRAELVSLRPGVLTLRLVTEGEQARLLGTLERDGKLIPSGDSDRISLSGNRFLPQGSQANPLVYTWQ